MHFIGMLAFSLPVAIGFDLEITLLSLAIAIAASALALSMLRRSDINIPALTVAGTLIGVGIAAMHYTGMMALRMLPPIRYTPYLFIASVMIAIVAALAALKLAFWLRFAQSGLAVAAKLGSAVIMGVAISGMHYTGMAAAEFAPNAISLAADSTFGLSNEALAIIVGTATLLLLLSTLVMSSVDAHSALHTARLAVALQAANHELRSVAFHDALTGLPNRVLLNDRMQQARNRAERSGRSFGLMFIDLDGFKQVNDQHGHAAGDLLLQEAASRLQAALRKEDSVARVGGDEFVVLLSELGSRSETATVGNKLMQELMRPFLIEGRSLQISGSIGISVYPEDDLDLHKLLEKADAAMYHVKHNGRNGVGFYSPEGQAG
jgi:diguanylate cyclase (GGDEF)-like protein